MQKETFNSLLKKAGISKKEFAERFEMQYGSVANWGNVDRPIPLWVESWLGLYIEVQQCRTMKSLLKEMEVC